MGTFSIWTVWTGPLTWFKDRDRQIVTCMNFHIILICSLFICRKSISCSLSWTCWTAMTSQDTYWGPILKRYTSLLCLHHMQDLDTHDMYMNQDTDDWATLKHDFTKIKKLKETTQLCEVTWAHKQCSDLVVFFLGLSPLPGGLVSDVVKNADRQKFVHWKDHLACLW